MYDYKDPRGRARLAIGAVIFSMLANLVFAAGEYMTARAIEQYQKAATNMSALEQVDAIGMFTGVGTLVSILVTATISAFWIHRVNKNAWVVSQGDMSVSPGWNVGYFFVPFVNLLLPFRGLRETLQTSTNPYEAGAVAVPVLMRLWWACWLIGAVLNNFSFRRSLTADTLDELRELAWFNIYLTAFDLATAWLFIAVIRDITRRQVENIPRYLPSAEDAVGVD